MYLIYVISFISHLKSGTAPPSIAFGDISDVSNMEDRDERIDSLDGLREMIQEPLFLSSYERDSSPHPMPILLYPGVQHVRLLKVDLTHSPTHKKKL